MCVFQQQYVRESKEMKREFDLLAQTQLSLVFAFLVMVFQAFFHNDSIFTFEPVSWLTASIVATIGLRRRSASLASGIDDSQAWEFDHEFHKQ